MTQFPLNTSLYNYNLLFLKQKQTKKKKKIALVRLNISREQKIKKTIHNLQIN